MGITHPKVLAQADDADPNTASPSDWNADHTVTDLAASGTLTLTGDISPTALSANVDDYAPTGLSTASTLRLSTNSSANRSINGLTGGADGRILMVHNVGTGIIGFKDEGGSSTAANRFALAGDMNLLPDSSCLFQYDGTSSRWRVLARATAATDPALTFDATNVGGTSPYFVRSDDQLALFDATAPSTQAFGDSAVVGTVGKAARRDHKHAMPAAPTTLIGTDTAWAAKGDLIVATANDTAAVLPIGTNGQGLMADSTATPGVRWESKKIAAIVATTSAISTTETVVASGTIPANTLAVGDTFKIRCRADGTTGVTPGTATPRIRFGPTTLTGAVLVGSAATMVASRTGMSFWMDAEVVVRTIGATGTMTGLNAIHSRPSTSDLFLVGANPILGGILDVVVDTTIDNLMQLTFVTSQSGSSCIFYLASIVKV